AGQAEGDRSPPGVLDRDGAAVVGESDARPGEACGQCVEVRPGREGDGDVGQPQACGARTGTAAVPGVHRDVVVVSAGCGEQGAGMVARGDLEAEGVDVEPACGVHVTDLQVHV